MSRAGRRLQAAELDLPFNLVDLLAIGLIAMAVIFGWRSGFVIQAFALGGFLIGLGAVVVLAPHLATLVEDSDVYVRLFVVLGAVAGLVLVGQWLGGSLGTAIRRRMGRGVLSGVDQGAGALFGFARGIFTVWLLAGLLGLFPVPSLAAEARQSTIVRAIETRFPSPVVLAAELGRIIQAAGLPDVFVGVPPPITIPQGGPSEAEAEEIAAAARLSTVRVEAAACGRLLTGSGFAIVADQVVTNAHVVAGAERVWISFDGSLDRLNTEVVHFDGDLDVALLDVPGLDLAPLRLAGDVPDPGTSAAALGFTGGGRQRLIPAIVTRTLDALGRDIYGNTTVSRDVIELRADVAPGDSGGPVIVDGRVGGVTFSESRLNSSIGYALSPVAVADSIDAAIGSGEPVATGPCLPQ
jgi:S1-C subfamily serine protease